jgi:membrane fusion protein (multidrug efflux system)
MSIRSLFPSSFLFLALLLASGCDRSPQAKAPQAATALPEVGVVAITPQRVPLTTVLAGRTAAFLKAEVRPQVGGIIQKRLFTEGSEVQAGQPLYRIDPDTFQAAFDNAQAALAQAEAGAAPARLKAARYAELVKTGAVSTQDNDDAKAADLLAQAQVKAARAALASARIDLGRTTVTSPIGGRIGASTVTPGALVTASQATALATVQQTDPIYVDVTQSSRELLALRRALASGRLARSPEGAARVRLLYEDGSPYPLEGALQFTDITVDQDTGVFTLRALFPNPDRALLPGMYVRALLEEGVAESAILAPQPAVSRDAKGNPYALVALPDGTLEQRALTVDRVVGGAWLVTSGLAAGDLVVVEGLQKVRAGMQAKPVPAAPPAAAPAKTE